MNPLGMVVALSPGTVSEFNPDIAGENESNPEHLPASYPKLVYDILQSGVLCEVPRLGAMDHAAAVALNP